MRRSILVHATNGTARIPSSSQVLSIVFAGLLLSHVESFFEPVVYNRFGRKLRRDAACISGNLYPGGSSNTRIRRTCVTRRAKEGDDESIPATEIQSFEHNPDFFYHNDDSDDEWMANLMKGTKDLTVGDWVVAKRQLPSLGVRAGAVYRIVSMYLKGGNGKDGLGVETIPLERYGDDVMLGYTRYLKIYNPKDHDGNENTREGVVVTPEEIGLVSVRSDWTEALYLAIPGFFWVFVASAFSNYYTDRYGGSFWDAFFRT